MLHTKLHIGMLNASVGQTQVAKAKSTLADTGCKGKVYLGSFVHYSDVKGHVAQLKGGDASEGSTNDASVLHYLLHRLLLPLLLLLVQAAQLRPQRPPLSIVLHHYRHLHAASEVLHPASCIQNQ